MSKNFEHTPVNVVAARGDTCVSKTSPKSSNITVMACVNAAGGRMPPMFIAKGIYDIKVLGHVKFKLIMTPTVYLHLVP